MMKSANEPGAKIGGAVASASLHEEARSHSKRSFRDLTRGHDEESATISRLLERLRNVRIKLQKQNEALNKYHKKSKDLRDSQSDSSKHGQECARGQIDRDPSDEQPRPSSVTSMDDRRPELISHNQRSRLPGGLYSREEIPRTMTSSVDVDTIAKEAPVDKNGPFATPLSSNKTDRQTHPSRRPEKSTPTTQQSQIVTVTDPGRVIRVSLVPSVHTDRLLHLADDLVRDLSHFSEAGDLLMKFSQHAIGAIRSANGIDNLDEWHVWYDLDVAQRNMARLYASAVTSKMLYSIAISDYKDAVAVGEQTSKGEETETAEAQGEVGDEEHGEGAVREQVNTREEEPHGDEGNGGVDKSEEGAGNPDENAGDGEDNNDHDGDNEDNGEDSNGDNDDGDDDDDDDDNDNDNDSEDGDDNYNQDGDVPDEYATRLDADQASGLIPASATAYTTLEVRPLTEDEGRCLICLEEKTLESNVTVLPCQAGHAFHGECIEHWLKVGRSCPACRYRLAITRSGH